MPASHLPAAADIEEQAAIWFAECCHPTCSESLRRACRDWQQQDPRHATAYRRLEAIWQASAALPLSADLPPRAARTFSRRRVLGGLAGAGLCAFGGIWLWQQQGLIETDNGQTLSLNWLDGSLLHLSAASALRLYQTDDGKQPRRFVLQRGECYLQAASRLTLEALGARCALPAESAVACGLEQDQAVLTVAQGTVDFVLGGARQTLQGGQRILWRGAQVLGVQQVDVAQTLAWRKGRLVFFDTPLAVVLEHIQRWQGGHLWVFEQKLAKRPVSLLFDLNSGNDALDLLQEALPIRIRRLGSVAVIQRR